MTLKEKAKALIDELPEDVIELAIKKLEALKSKDKNPFRKIIGIVDHGNLTKNIDQELYGR